METDLIALIDTPGVLQGNFFELYYMCLHDEPLWRCVQSQSKEAISISLARMQTVTLALSKIPIYQQKLPTEHIVLYHMV